LSTKNKAKARDTEMSSTKKGNDWYFGSEEDQKLIQWGLLKTSFQFAAETVRSVRTLINCRNNNTMAAAIFQLHGDGAQEGLEFHVFGPPADRSGKSVERLGRPMRAFDAPAVAGVDRVFVLAPCQAPAPSA